MRQKFPHILEIQGFDLVRHPEWFLADETWALLFRQQQQPLRFITMHVPFNLQEPVDQLQKACKPLNRWAREYAPLAKLVDAWEAAYPQEDHQFREDLYAAMNNLPADLKEQVQQIAPSNADIDSMSLEDWQGVIDALRSPLWKRAALQDYTQWYSSLSHQALRGLRHFAITWSHDSSEVAVRDLKQQMTYTLRTPVTSTDLPSIFPGIYYEDGQYLLPEEPHHPVAAILTAHDVKGEWKSGDVFHGLLSLGIDMSIMIDVHPTNRTQAHLRAEYYSNVNEAREQRGESKDIKAEKRGRAAEVARYALEEGQNFHQVTIHIAVFAEDQDELASSIQIIKSATETKLPLIHTPGVQAQLAKFWTTTETDRIDAGPARRTRQILSHGVASLLPLGLNMPSRTDGIMWLRQGKQTPIFFDPFRGGRPGHMVVIGLTGAGKTYAINTWLRRLLAMGCKVIMMEPQGHSKRLVNAVGHGGQYHPLTLQNAINPLDVVAYHKEDDDLDHKQGKSVSLLLDQVEHVLAQLSVLLGTNEQIVVGGVPKTTFTPKVWSDSERAILRAALSRLYEPYNLETLSAEQAPVLADFITTLKEVADAMEHGTQGFPHDLKQAENTRRLISLFQLTFLQGSAFGDAINRRTTIDRSFNLPLTAFGLSGLPEGLWRTYYFGQLFGTINRWIRSPGRDRTHPVIVVFDEFAFSLRMIPTLAAFAADAAKTWRAFNAHFWTADQDLHSYAGTNDNDKNPDLYAVWLNSQLKMIMLQQRDPAQRLKQIYPDIHDGHVKAITEFQEGEGILLWKAGDSANLEIFQGYVDSTSDEKRLFSGT